MHARELIRKAIAAAVTGLTTTGTNVFTNHVYPYSAADLPNLSIYTASSPELVEDEGVMGSYQLRVLPVEIVARAKATADLDDTLDDICAEVEIALMASSAVSALVKDFRLISTEIEIEGEGEKPVGAARMEWQAIYRVNGDSPTTPEQ